MRSTPRNGETKMKQKRQQAPLERINPDPQTGLTREQVEERIRKGYVNLADDPNEKGAFKIVIGNLFTFFNVVLFLIAFMFIGFIIYLNASGHSDIADKYFGFSKFVFLIPAILNVALGSFQEMKSLRAIKKLKIVTETKAKVIRDGKIEWTEAAGIVSYRR